jgi:MFS transporter, FHS family, glucose/mannose:H+ symporter
MVEISVTAKPVFTRRTLSTAVLSAGFSLTGAGTVLLGVLLPTLSQKWGLRDDQAGLLLFIQFFASGLGAIVTGLNRVRALATGYGLMAGGTCVLALGSFAAAYVAIFFWGLGLGMAMTATSLLFSDRWGDDRAAKLEWLNFVWSAGATAGPILYLPFLGRGNLRLLFLTLLSLSLVMFFWVLAAERKEPSFTHTKGAKAAGGSLPKIFWLLMLFAMFAVGVEVAISSWLTTYSHRAGMRSLAGTAIATSIFWLGEMASRLAFSTRLLARVGRWSVLQWGVWGITGAAVVLIAFPHPWAILVVAGLAGASVGPLYPLSLSFLLEHSPWGWFFSVGGIGAAVLPWLTGVTSAHFHSLRYGLAVPCATALAMIVLTAVIPLAGPVRGRPSPGT